MNYSASNLCNATPATNVNVCQGAVFDADWHSEGSDHFDAPHPSAPLRLARLAQVRATDLPSLNHSWAPRLIGVPQAQDDTGWKGGGPLVGLVNAYVNPLGQHVFVFGDACKSFDDAVYYDNVLIRFFASGGEDLYFLSHPASHRCLGSQSCAFLQ